MKKRNNYHGSLDVTDTENLKEIQKKQKNKTKGYIYVIDKYHFWGIPDGHWEEVTILAERIRDESDETEYLVRTKKGEVLESGRVFRAKLTN